MKNLLIIFTLLVSTILFSSPSFAEWTKLVADADGNTFYVDCERIRKHDGYVYYWELGNFLKPIEGGVLSFKRYRKGDCKLFRFKNLSYSFHKEPMSGGTGETTNPKNPEWDYPSPNSIDETHIKNSVVVEYNYEEPTPHIYTVILNSILVIECCVEC